MKKIFLLTIFFLGFAAALAQDTKNRPQYVITITQNGRTLGNITIELFPDVAPKHVRNFDSLVSIGFYDGTVFHRVVPDFVIQGGGINSKDPMIPREKWGFSDSTQNHVPAEFSELKHERGIISAARAGNDINSATSQFFIVLDDLSNLNGKYSIFGQVLSGMDVVDEIVELPQDDKNNPLDRVEMTVRKK